jgi:NhaP-type Na+/H+ and K+/H+ antiporter
MKTFKIMENNKYLVKYLFYMKKDIIIYIIFTKKDSSINIRRLFSKQPHKNFKKSFKDYFYNKYRSFFKDEEIIYEQYLWSNANVPTYIINFLEENMNEKFKMSL